MGEDSMCNKHVYSGEKKTTGEHFETFYSIISRLPQTQICNWRAELIRDLQML